MEALYSYFVFVRNRHDFLVVNWAMVNIGVDLFIHHSYCSNCFYPFIATKITRRCAAIHSADVEFSTPVVDNR